MSRKRKNREVKIPQIANIQSVTVIVSEEEVSYKIKLWNKLEMAKCNRALAQVLEMMMS